MHRTVLAIEEPQTDIADRAASGEIAQFRRR